MADDFFDARFSVATLDWAREEHATLANHAPNRIDGDRLRATVLSDLLGRVAARVRAHVR